MSKVDKINRSNLRKINAEIKNAMKDIEKKFGVKVELGNSRFTSENYSTKLKVSVVSDDGVVLSKEATSFNKLAESYGVTLDIEVGQRFRTTSGETFVLKGLNTRARKYPIQASNRDGRYKLPIRALNNATVVSY